MENMKTGYIAKILKQDNLGIIREDNTLTEFLFFLDDLDQRVVCGDQVRFVRDANFEQFVASNVAITLTRISA